MSNSVIVFNTAQHSTLESYSSQKLEEMLKEDREKCAIALGRQLLKRKLITFEVEERPGPNAGQRKVTVKGTVTVDKPAVQ